VLLVPADAEVHVPLLAEHLEDDAGSAGLSGRVPVDDDDVSRLRVVEPALHGLLP
jgi:hypothetical protein